MLAGPVGAFLMAETTTTTTHLDLASDAASAAVTFRQCESIGPSPHFGKAINSTTRGIRSLAQREEKNLPGRNNENSDFGMNGIATVPRYAEYLAHSAAVLQALSREEVLNVPQSF